MTFTVKDLKEQLAELPDDLVLILQRDDEGNGYRYARGLDADNLVFVKGCYNEGDVMFMTLTDELEADGYSEEDTFEGEYPEDSERPAFEKCGVFF